MAIRFPARKGSNNKAQIRSQLVGRRIVRLRPAVFDPRGDAVGLCAARASGSRSAARSKPCAAVRG